MYPIRKHVLFLCGAAFMCCMIFIYLLNCNEDKFSYNQIQSPGLFANKLTGGRGKNVSTCNESRSTRYFVALNYWEQMNMALQNMYSLTRLVNVWNGVLVHPFTSNSRLFGLPHLRANENWSMNVSAFLLSWLFDLENLNYLSCIDGFKTLCEFDRFIKHANRDVIILHFIFPKEAREFAVTQGAVGNELKIKLQHNNTFECSNYPTITFIKEDIMKSLNREALSHSTGEFRLFKYWCINAILKTTPEDMAERMGLLHNDKTVLILNWRGLRTSLSPFQSAKGLHIAQRQFITLPDTANNHVKKIYHPSDNIRVMSSQFVQTVTQGGNGFIAVHIRSEKLGQRGARIPNYINTCIDKATELKNDIIKTLSGSISTLFFTDYGPFGSDSCRNCKGAKIVQSLFHQYGIKPTSFDPVEYGIPSDSGYVSLVEMNALTQSQYLILVGGGAYQRQTTMQIGDNVRKVYSVCWDDYMQVKRIQ